MTEVQDTRIDQGAPAGASKRLVSLNAYRGAIMVMMASSGLGLAYWLAFALYPSPAADFDWQSVGVPADWPHLTAFASHWEKNANFAAAFHRWFLNLFPREKPFVFSGGGYQTLNLIPSIATMVFGLLAGELMKSNLPIPAKIRRLLLVDSRGQRTLHAPPATQETLAPPAPVTDHEVAEAGLADDSWPIRPFVTQPSRFRPVNPGSRVSHAVRSSMVLPMRW